jgi:signal transduction histidine kinase
MDWRPRGTALLLVVAVVGGGSLVLGLSAASERGLMHAETPVAALLIGWSFAGAGIVAVLLRPDNRFGLLLYGTGLVWFSSVLMASDVSVVFTLGLLTAPWWLGLFLHVLFAFPGGRLDDRWSRVVVGVLYVDVTLVQAVRLLFTSASDLPSCTDCPENALLLSDQPDVAMSMLVVQQAVVGSLVVAATLAILTRRWLRATTHQRRVLSPVLVTGAIFMVVQAAVLATTEPSAVRQSLGWLGAAALAAVPLAFLLGLLRQRLDRAAVGRLVVDLEATAGGDPVDGLLRAALRDPSLQVGYWREDLGGYVDASGRSFPVPTAAGRGVTAVEREGRRIAVLLHDEWLADDPALVSGAVAAAGLALDNARLHAEVRAQMEELRASRRRLVEAGDQERRRLERNLHDGAQQRLLAVSLLLGELERAGDQARAGELAVRAKEELARSLAELRQLAAGLHPAVLTDHGLAVALEGLAARTPVRVDLALDLPERPAPEVEVAVYYVVSESLTNAVKHAAATRVAVRVSSEDAALRVTVIDDGVGGAEPGRGTGLQGLRDRVAALDGGLDVTSPAGQGTTVEAAIPCG